MEIRVNTKIIKSFNPCNDRLDNWVKHYPKFNSDITKFLKLKNITYSDKLWIAKKLVPIEILIVFALDCAFSAAEYAEDAAKYAAEDAAKYAEYAAEDAAYAAEYAASGAAEDAAEYAEYAAEYAEYAAEYAAKYAAKYAVKCATRKKEQSRQIEALIYLIKGE